MCQIYRLVLVFSRVNWWPVTIDIYGLDLECSTGETRPGLAPTTYNTLGKCVPLCLVTFDLQLYIIQFSMRSLNNIWQN